MTMDEYIKWLEEQVEAWNVLRVEDMTPCKTSVPVFYIRRAKEPSKDEAGIAPAAHKIGKLRDAAASYPMNEFARNLKVARQICIYPVNTN